MFSWRRKRREAGTGNFPVPEHIAIIMDGNGRWAQKRGLPRAAGHAAGSNTFKDIAGFCEDLGVKYLTVYAFSTENWARPDEEVASIMELLSKYLSDAIERIKTESTRLRILGDYSVLGADIIEKIELAHELSQKNNGMQVNVCINYGGRAEIAHAVRGIAGEIEAGTLRASDIDEGTVERNLYTAGIADPGLVIRAGGESRISNFLLWQSSYSELYMTRLLWPDFKRDDLVSAIEFFNARDRRFGKIRKDMGADK